MSVREFYDNNSFLFEFHYNELKKLVDESGEKLEGNCYSYHETTKPYPALVNKRANILWFSLNAKKVAEIGFNAGHSATLMMSLCSEDTEFTFFDLGEHAYTRPCFKYVTQVFNRASNLVLGDSRITMPNYIRDHPELIGAYDIVHVDGGHQKECFFSDISNALLLVKRGGLLFIDDTNIDYIDAWVNTLIAEKIVGKMDHLETEGYKHRVVVKL